MTGVEGESLGVGGTRLIRLREISAENGSLVVGELPGSLPFVVRRFFALYGIPEGEARGTHAHRECEQFLVHGCVDATKTPEYRAYMRDMAKQLIATHTDIPTFRGWVKSVR